MKLYRVVNQARLRTDFEKNFELISGTETTLANKFSQIIFIWKFYLICLDCIVMQSFRPKNVFEGAIEPMISYQSIFRDFWACLQLQFSFGLGLNFSGSNVT